MGLSEFVQQVCEHMTMKNILAKLFSIKFRSAELHKYRPGNVTVYYENPNAVRIHKVDLQKTIKDITSEKGFFVVDGSLPFYVLLTGSRHEQNFIKESNDRWRKKMSKY